ncbi:MAG TPA: response regulator, partial [Polyangia bacterium]|nr:response regulator [Polyangia bacterium]
MKHDYILVVDDDDAVRDTVVDVLQDAEYPVRVARDGQEALDILRRGTGRPCLVLLDLMMPGMNGWDFAREQAGDPALANIPICLVTAVGRAQQIPQKVVAV